MTLAATASTAPLVAHHFGSVSVAGLPANVLALPLVAPIMWLGMVRAALGQLGALGQLPSGLAGLALDPLLGALGFLAGEFAEMPGGQLALPLRGPGGWLSATWPLAPQPQACTGSDAGSIPRPRRHAGAGRGRAGAQPWWPAWER